MKIQYPKVSNCDSLKRMLFIFVFLRKSKIQEITATRQYIQQSIEKSYLELRPHSKRPAAAILLRDFGAHDTDNFEPTIG